jgi:putative spermidine/putrescine transport system ATP-binding protein
MPGRACALVVRPERVAVAPSGGASSGGALPGRVVLATYLGGLTDWHVETAAGTILVTRPTPPEGDKLRRLAPGDVVTLDWTAQAGRLLDDEGETKT